MRALPCEKPNTAQLTDQLQNPAKIITGTVAGGSPLTIPEQGTMNHGLCGVGFSLINFSTLTSYNAQGALLFVIGRG